ncbi:hypothetical protein KWH48_17530 [Xanthomonas campestris pv. euphorbiae]|nr:hypothetical protein [Xanthomonas campestris pv. euphorbiae]
MLELLGEVWRLEPDLRLGQLVQNAARFLDPDLIDIHLTEDRNLRRGLARYLELLKSQRPSGIAS